MKNKTAAVWTYRSIVETAMKDAAPDPSLTERWFDLLDDARNLDRLIETVACDARHIGDRFTQFAARVAEDHHTYASTPCGYSTLSDIAQNAARYEVLSQAFARQFRSVTGRTLPDAIEAAKAATKAA